MPPGEGDLIARPGLWTYHDVAWTTSSLTGYDVEATDGTIGTIDEAGYDLHAGYLVVDTGPWIFGKKVLLPAGMIDRVDFHAEKVWVNRLREEIRNAPEFDPETHLTEDYRDAIAAYYAPR